MVKLGSEPHYFFVDTETVSQILAENGISTEHPHYEFYKKYILDQMRGTFFASPEEREQSILNYIPKIASLSFRKKTDKDYFPPPSVTKQELKRLYKQEVKGLLDEELLAEVFSKFLYAFESFAEDTPFTAERSMNAPILRKLRHASSPQEQMLAIDWVINKMHTTGYWADAVIKDFDPSFLDELSNLKVSSLNIRKKADEYETLQENFYEPGKSDEYPKGPKKPKRRFPFHNYPDDQGNIINVDPNYSNPMEYDTTPGPHPQGPGLFGNLGMRKAVKTIRLFRVFGMDEWKEEFLQRGVTPNDLNDISSYSSPRADKKCILVASPTDYSWSNEPTATNFVELEFIKPLNEVYVDYDEPVAAIHEERLPEGEVTYEKLTDLEGSLYGAFVLDIKPQEIVSVRRKIEPGLFGRLSMRKKADEEKSSVEVLLQELAEIQFEITDPEDVRTFVNEISMKLNIAYHFINGLILEHMVAFPHSFIENWKIYVAEEYDFDETFSEELARKVIGEILGELYEGMPKPISEEFKTKPPKEKLTEETVEVPYAELLNKYTTDQIFDIAAGRKTDVTAEEIEQAKDVITRGIVANKLGMRKEGKGLKEYIRENIEDQFIIPQQLKLRFGKVAQAEFNVGNEITFDTTRYLGRGKKRVGGVLKGKGVITKKEDNTYSIEITELTEVAEDLKNIFRSGLTAEFALDEIKLEKPKVEPKKEIPVEKPEPKEKIPAFELEEEPPKLRFELEEKEEEIPTPVEEFGEPKEVEKEEEEEKEKIPFWKELVQETWKGFKRPISLKRPFGSKLNMKKIAGIEEHEYKWKEIHQGKIPTYIFQGFQEGTYGEKYILVNCNICKSTLLLTAKEVKANEYKIKGLPRGWEQEVKLSAKKYKGPIKSILEDIAQDVWTTSDLEEAKNKIINRVEDSKIDEDDKQKIIETTNKIDTLLELQKYIANSILFYEGMGTKLSMRKKAQIDKQMFFDFYGVSLLSDQYLEANPYAKEYKDMIVNQMKEVYVPLVINSIYKALLYATGKGVSFRLLDWNKWKKEFNIKNVGELKNLTLEQVSRIWREGEWDEWLTRKVRPWADITDSLIQLKNTTDTNQLIIIIDHINNIQHNTGLLLGDFPEVKHWIEEALEIKAGATSAQLIPYLSTDIQEFVTENLQLKGEEVVAPEKFLTGLEKSRLAIDPKTSVDILAELAKDEDLGVRWEVAKNKNTSLETLTELVKDKEDFVRDEAKKRLEELEDILEPKLSIRKKAKVFVEGTPTTDEGSWAIYQGNVYITYDLLKVHAMWFEELGLPSAGPEYDNIVRGYFARGYIVWYGTGDYNEFYDHLEELRTAIGYPEDAPIKMIDYTTQEFTTLAMRKFQFEEEEEMDEESFWLNLPLVSQRKLIELYTQEAKGLYNEELMDEIISSFIESLNMAEKFGRSEIPPTMTDYLIKAKTPQEKMIAIDQALHEMHFLGEMGEYLIEDYTPEFFDELSNLKVSNLNMGKQATVPVPLRMSLDYPHSWPQKKKKKKEDKEEKKAFLKIAQDVSDPNKLSVQELKSFYELEPKRLLDDEFVDEVLSKLIYGMQKEKERVESDPSVRRYPKRDFIVSMDDSINDLENVSVKSLNEKIVEIDQTIHLLHLSKGLGVFQGDFDEIWNTIEFIGEKESLEATMNLNMRKKAMNVSVPTPSDSLHEQQGEQNSWHTYFQGKDKWIMREPDQGFDIDFPSKERIKRSPWPFDDTTPTSQTMASLSMRKTTQVFAVKEPVIPRPQTRKQDLKKLYLQEVEGIYDKELMDQILFDFIVVLEGMIEWVNWTLSESRNKQKMKQWSRFREVATDALQILKSVTTSPSQEKMIAIDRVINLVHRTGNLGNYLVADIDLDAFMFGGADPFFKELSNLYKSKDVKKFEESYKATDTGDVTTNIHDLFQEMGSEDQEEEFMKNFADQIEKLIDEGYEVGEAYQIVYEEDYQRSLREGVEVGEGKGLWTKKFRNLLKKYLKERDIDLPPQTMASLNMRKTAQVSLETLKQFYTDMETEQYNEKRCLYILKNWSRILDTLKKPANVSNEEFEEFKSRVSSFLNIDLTLYGSFELTTQVDGVIDFLHEGYPEFRYQFVSGNKEEIDVWFDLPSEGRTKEASILSMQKLERVDDYVDGMWAIYNGKVYVQEATLEFPFVHEPWFGCIGLPTVGEAFDNVVRGYYRSGMITWYKNTGTLEEFLNNLPELLTKLNYSEDAPLRELDLDSGNYTKIKNPFVREASILDYPQKHLDSAMWDLSGDLPKLKENIKGLIVERFLDYLREEGKLNNPDLWCKGFYYTGSTATYRYRPTSDIDIHVEVDWEKFSKANPDKAKDDIEEMRKDLLQVFWNTLNKEVLPNTQHPLTYYVLSEKENVFEQGEEAYDILNDSWIVPPHKIPENLDIDEKIELLGTQANAIMERLDEELGKTKRDFIDYKILKELLDSYEGDKKDIQKLIEKKLDDVEQGLKRLQEENVKIHEERQEAFYDGQEPIEEGLSQNWAPGNIVFKLVEKYRYVDVLRKIKHIIEDEKITEEEEKQLEDLLEPKLSMRKKAQTPKVWAIYKNEIYIKPTTGEWLEHANWFKRIGLPDCGPEFDEVCRGGYDPEEDELYWYEEAGTFEEFIDNLSELVEKLKVPTDTLVINFLYSAPSSLYEKKSRKRILYKDLFTNVSLSMRKRAQIDKQMFFDFYGVSLLSDQYLEANPYAKEYKDMIVQQIKDAYVPLITKMVYSELSKHTSELDNWWDWQEKFNITKPKDLSLEQLAQVYNKGDWQEEYGGSAWGSIVESLIQLKNTTDTNQLITIIDHINDIQHNTGLMFHDFPKVEKWFSDALEVKAQATPE
ncbi:MAG: HEAT repeat domain-containing protein, partial [Candidatus Cloacimonetes bacterium]|nr:HEAT repeat domain-containing protein [Candidatus Cloacimonadota bacterium]